MKFFTVSIKKANDAFTTAMNEYDTLGEAKANAYSALTEGYSNDVELCSVSVIDEMFNTFLKEYVANTTEE